MHVLKSLESMSSGYIPGETQWVDFISCWFQLQRLDKAMECCDFLRISERRIDEDSIENFDVNSFIDLPQSVLDFHEVYRSMRGEYLNENENFGIGILDLAEIKPLPMYDPGLYTIHTELPCNSNNSDYYRYGLDQDYVDVRTDYLENALVIGRYEGNSSDLILLYPDSRTSDGEMETAVLGQAWIFRTPSFAEMMRQYSVYYLYLTELKLNSGPPYSQDLLRNTCADCIKLSDVWWR